MRTATPLLISLAAILAVAAGPATTQFDLRDEMTEGEALRAIAAMPEPVQTALVAGEQARRRAIKNHEEVLQRLRGGPQTAEAWRLPRSRASRGNPK